MSTPPVLLGRVIDKTLEDGDAPWLMLGLSLVTAILAFGLQYYLSKLLSTFAAQLIRQKYLDSVQMILTRERSLFRRKKMGELIDIFGKYISSFEDLVVGLILSAIPSLVAIAVLLIAIGISSSAEIMLMVLGLQLLLVLPIFIQMQSYARKLSNHTQSNYQLSDEWVEILGTNKVIQNELSLDLARDRLTTKVNQMAKTYIDFNRSKDLIHNSVSFNQLLSLLALVGIFLFFGRQGAATSTGSLVSVFALTGMLLNHFRSLCDFSVVYRNYKNYLNDYNQLAMTPSYLVSLPSDWPSIPVAKNTQAFVPMNRLESIADGLNPSMSGELRIKGLTVQRQGKNIFSLGQELIIKPGEKVLVLGLSGAGKTSFLSAFFNANREFQDTVFLDGQPISKIPSVVYQRIVRISFQENEIMSGTGYYNWFQRQVDPIVAQQLLEELRLDKDLCLGQKDLEPWSGNISGGEAKRLNLARLLVQPGLINIFDEPTTGLNRSLGRQVWNLIFTKLRDATIICASHDLTALNNFTRVLLIEGGQIVADLPPTQINQNPAFIRIHERIS